MGWKKTPPMSEPFDPYQQWLGIAKNEQPANHYRLLGIEPFESDEKVINAAAEQRLSYLSNFKNTQQGADAQKLESAVSSARVCLINPRTKARYDEQLRTQLKTAPTASNSRVTRPPRPAAVDPMAPVAAPPPQPAPAPMGQAAAVPSTPPHPAAAPTQVPNVQPAANNESAGFAVDTAAPKLERRSTVYRAEDAEPPETAPLTLGIPLIPFLGLSALVIALLAILIVFVQNRKARQNVVVEQGPAAIELPDEIDESTVGKRVIVPEGVVAQDEQGDLLLSADMAKVTGSADPSGDVIHWTPDIESIRWEVLVSKPGMFMIEATYAATGDAAGDEAKFSIAGRKVYLRVRDTGGWNSFVTDQTKMVVIKSAGQYELTATAYEPQSGQTLMHLKAVRLRRAAVGKRPSE